MLLNPRQEKVNPVVTTSDYMRELYGGRNSCQKD